MYKKYIKCLFVLIFSIAFIGFFTSYGDLHSSAKSVKANNDINNIVQPTSSDPTMTANLYFDPECTQLDQEVTTTGGALNNKWQANTSRYLKIEISNMDDSEFYKVVIDLDQHLYANIKTMPTDSNFSEINFTKNDPITVNTNKTYDLEEYSGKFEYVTKVGYTSVSLVLEIRYDNVLWNKRANMDLNPVDEEILLVELKNSSDEILDNKFITKVTTGSALSYPFAYYVKTDTTPSYTSGTIYANSENTVSFTLLTQTMDTDMIGCYYEEMQIEMDVPRSGEHLMEFDENDFRFYVHSGIANYEYSYDSTNDKIVILLKDFYYTKKTFFLITFSFGDEMLNATGKYSYTGNINIYLPKVGTNGSDLKAFNTSYQIVMQNDAAPNLTFSSVSGNADYRNKNAVQILGGYGLINTGGASGPQTVYMTFNDDNTNGAKALVTTFRLMPDNISDYLDIEYTLVDKDGNEIWFDADGNVVPKGTDGATREYVYKLKNKYKGVVLQSSNSILFNRGMLPANHREYYFSSLKYTIQSVPENTKLWHGSATISYTSSNGTFWGYIVSDQAATLKHTIRIYDELGNENVTLRKVVSTNIRLVESVSFGLNTISISKENITAGESLKISGRAFVINYPYSANNVLNVEGYNMRIGISLPKGASVNADSISITTRNKTELNVVSVTGEEQTDGTVFWIIEIEAVEGNEIGYVSESLGMLPNGDYVSFSFELNTERTTAGTLVSLKENMYFAAYKITNAAGGSYSPYGSRDKYDLNGNGSTTDKVGIIGGTDESFQINALSANLTIKDELRSSDNSQTDKTISLSKYDDYIIYDLSIICDSGGRADDFVYFIPIANNNTSLNEIILDNNASFVMSEAATVYNSISSNGVKVYYTNKKDLTYNDALVLTDWFEELPSDVTWSDITMVKIVSADDYISNGSESLVSLKLNYSKTEEEFISEAGMKATWNSRGYYNYTIGTRMISGHFSTSVNTISLTYTMPVQEITLTAAKDRNPSTGVEKYTIKDIPLFLNNQEYIVSNIYTHNVTLLSKDYFVNYASLMNSDDANRSFGFTVSLNGGAEIDMNTTLPINLGLVAGNDKTELTFEIYNADIISDITTLRYIELTLEGNNGVIIPVKIKIDRELTEVLATEIGITTGKQYRPFSTQDTIVEISNDSSLTAQFVGELFPNNYKSRYITFKENILKDTTIVLVDWTNTDIIEYYYYYVLEDTNNINLTEFIKMGTVDEYYENPVGDVIINESLLFILDFEKTKINVDNSITLNRVLTDDSVTSDELLFTTKDNRKFDISIEKSNVKIGENINITYEVGEIDYADSRFNDNKLSLVLSTSADSYLPADAHLIYNNMIYYANGNGEFIIPLGNAQNSGEFEIELKLESQTILSNQGSVKLEACIWSSTNELKPFGGIIITDSCELVITTETSCSFKVEAMSNRFLTKVDLKNIINISYQTKEVIKLTVEVHQKIGEGYTLISTGINAINGNTTHSGGVFDISSAKSSINIKFNEMMESGSYKLIFKVYDDQNNEKMSIPYTFMVIE